MNEKTIIAITTPMAQSAVGVLRISGSGALFLLKKCFKGKLSEDGNTVSYGHLFSPQSGEKIDEVLVSVFRAPKSYTGEDIVEISAHGNPFLLKEILELFLSLGAKMAEPGEFTQRAYLNGKMSLSRAEAVESLIRAHTRFARFQSLSHLDGKFDSFIHAIHGELLNLIAETETAIDHSDIEELEGSLPDLSGYREKTRSIIEKIDALLSTAKSGKMLSDGLKVAILGAPNSGKSSLLNALLKKDRAIVSEIEGTTRDTIEAELNIRGIPVHLIDTAGIRHSEDSIEKIGIERSFQSAEAADFCLLLIDGSKDFKTQNLDGDFLSGKAFAVLLTKSDLPLRINSKKVESHFGKKPVFISAQKGDGIAEIEKTIFDFYFSFGHDPASEVMIANARQEHLLREALNYLELAENEINADHSEEFFALYFRRARESIEEITGKTTDDDILDRIFSKFCIGK